MDSLRDSEKLDAVGLPYTLLWFEKLEEVDDGKGLIYGCCGIGGDGPEKVFAPEGTDNRRLGVLAPPHDTGRALVDMGDRRPGGYCLGLPVAAEKVEEVGVVTLAD